MLQAGPDARLSNGTDSNLARLTLFAVPAHDHLLAAFPAVLFIFGFSS
jgi:hypothetical protein